MDPNKVDRKHAALIALTTAAEAFLEATNAALEEKFPGRGAQNRALLDEGRAHLCISLQCGSGQVKAALALCTPEFVTVLSDAEMELSASIASIFGDPERVSVVNLASLN